MVVVVVAMGWLLITGASVGASVGSGGATDGSGSGVVSSSSDSSSITTGSTAWVVGPAVVEVVLFPSWADQHQEGSGFEYEDGDMVLDDVDAILI